jgi:hypothetical protein
VGKPNPQNLKPWPKGVSGNPKGNPPTKHIEQIFQDFLNEIARSKDGQERARLEVIMARLFHDAAAGKERSAQILLERAFGRAKQDINLAGAVELKVEPLIIKKG